MYETQSLTPHTKMADEGLEQILRAADVPPVPKVARDETTESSDIFWMFASFICALLSKLRSLLAC